MNNFFFVKSQLIALKKIICSMQTYFILEYETLKYYLVLSLNQFGKDPTSGRLVLLLNWLTGSAGFNPSSRLLSQLFGVFHGFLRNSSKSGLVPLRKINKESTHPQALVPHAEIMPYIYNQPTKQFSRVQHLAALFNTF